MLARENRTRLLVCGCGLILALLAGCKPPAAGVSAPAASDALAGPCPAERPALPLLPDEQPQHHLAEHWLAQSSDELLISPARITEQNGRVAALREGERLTGRWPVESLELEGEAVSRLLQAKLAHLARGITAGERVLADGLPPNGLLLELEERCTTAQPVAEIRVVHRSTPLRCFPTVKGIYEKPWDLAFDLNRCSQLRRGEPVRVAAKAEGFFYVWAAYGDGWVDPAALTPALTAEQVQAYLHPAERAVVLLDRLAVFADPRGQTLAGEVRLGLELPLLARGEGGALQVLLPTPQGLSQGWLLEGARVGYEPLTRSGLFRRAFTLLDTPYGWGGSGQHRDCSRLMMDLFGTFGVSLPRNSWNQSRAGLRHVEVGELDEAAKREAIEQAARQGIVLLYFPGHIMLYVGREGDQLFAFHLFSGFLTTCPGGGETMNRVNRAVVTSLSLGKGSSRRSFLQRLTRLVLLEPAAQGAGG